MFKEIFLELFLDGKENEQTIKNLLEFLKENEITPDSSKIVFLMILPKDEIIQEETLIEKLSQIMIGEEIEETKESLLKILVCGKINGVESIVLKSYLEEECALLGVDPKDKTLQEIETELVKNRIQFYDFTQKMNSDSLF